LLDTFERHRIERIADVRQQHTDQMALGGAQPLSDAVRGDIAVREWPSSTRSRRHRQRTACRWMTRETVAGETPAFFATSLMFAIGYTYESASSKNVFRKV